MSKVHKSEVIWQDRVTLEVDKLKSQRQFRKKDEISKAWVSNRKYVERARFEMNQKCPTVPYVPIPKSVVNTDSTDPTGDGGGPPKKRKFVKVWNECLSLTSGADKGKKAQIAELSVIPPAVAPPPMSMWAPIEKNVLVEDQQHSNIPYFGDDVIEKDQNFIANLVEEVNSKMAMSEDIDDSMFLSLVNNLAVYEKSDMEKNDQSNKYLVLNRPKSALESSWAELSIKDRTLPGLIVFQAISSRYPDLGSTDDMLKKYKTLTNQKAKPDYVPNIDGPDAEAVTAERALHSYKSLLCRRCFLYDCPLHNDPYVETPVPRPSERIEDLPLPTSPCGPDCFLTIPGVLAAMSPRTPAIKGKSGDELRYNPKLCDELNPLKDITGTNMDVWTGSEITLFRMLAKSLPSNWCAIAQIMITKKCRQVWEFSKEEIENCGTRVKKTKTSTKSKQKKNTKAKQAALYKGHSQAGERENSHTYFPCHHPGQPCSEEVCTCKQSKNFCEKFCYCPIDCRDRFPGCRCKKACSNNLCACFLASRECDPDLCTSCLDGTLELNPETNSCRNVVLQRRMGKKLYVAPSDIAGWGCFLGDKAAKNEFIAEYVGEMITQEESERRGRVYDKAKCSYMFNLNDDFCVDAARIGGKIRFANHSSKPNCKVKILLVNGDHRIGIYANRNIELGEELFFNYGKDFHGHDIV